MKKNLLKIITIITIVIIMLLLYCTFNNKVEAVTNFDTNQYIDNLTTDSSDITELKSVGDTIVGIARGIGIIASVATLIVLGIKYMTGSVEERAQYKKTMLPYLIGAFMVFAITFFLSIVIEIAGQI